MKLTAFLVVIAMVPAWAQIQRGKPPAPSAVAAKPAGGTLPADNTTGAPVKLGDFERKLDDRISATGGADPCIVLGGNRGIYIPGVGAVFTSDVNLVNGPGGTLFQPSITPELRTQVHQRKLAHVALLQKTMREMVAAVASSPVMKLADTDQIVIAVRLDYRPWEDVTNLPGQIVMRADRRGGNIKMDMQ
jgi:hypothetical protein